MEEKLSLEPGKCIIATKKGGKTVVELRICKDKIMDYILRILFLTVVLVFLHSVIYNERVKKNYKNH